jgi:hypothetical protein
MDMAVAVRVVVAFPEVITPGRENDRYRPLSVAGLEVDGRPRVSEVGYDQVGGLDLRDDSCIDVVVVLYAIDALCSDSKRAESLSQSPENGIGVFVTKRHRDEAAQLCGHGQLAAGGLRFFSTSASVIIIIIGSTGHSWNPART